MQGKYHPYRIVKHIYVTEKSMMLQSLHTAESNSCLRRCERPRYVFVVDRSASKQEIARAVEEIYVERNIKVVAVNTIQVKGKERRRRGRRGMTPAFKKAIVTLEKGDSLED